MGDWSEYTGDGDVSSCDTSRAMVYTDGTDTSGGAGGNGCNFAWWYSAEASYGGPIEFKLEARQDTGGHLHVHAYTRGIRTSARTRTSATPGVPLTTASLCH